MIKTVIFGTLIISLLVIGVGFTIEEADARHEATPSISLDGANPQQIALNDPYDELGATCIDASSVDVSDSIVINATSVDTAIVGTYQVTYDCTDDYGTSSLQVTRTVNVHVECPEPISHYNIIYGTNGDDAISGTSGDDLIFGLDGYDYIDGLAGNDCIYGGAGGDEIYGSSGNDYIYGGSGDDGVNGDNGDDHVYGGSGDDEIEGSTGDDYLFAGTGNDNLDGQEGSDTCQIDDISEDTTLGCELIEYVE